jgi:hypothetical protein
MSFLKDMQVIEDKARDSNPLIFVEVLYTFKYRFDFELYLEVLFDVHEVFHFIIGSITFEMEHPEEHGSLYCLVSLIVASFDNIVNVIKKFEAIGGSGMILG